jgi:arsenical pump membrane protein
MPTLEQAGVIVVFGLVIYLLFKQPTFRVPFTQRYLTLDYSLAPLIGVLILLIAGVLSPFELWEAIKGGAVLKPYTIIILILSMSYVCLSLDHTGFFDYSSLKVLEKAKSSGRGLFFLIILWTFLLTLFTDNDIVILTMTFLICCFAYRASLNPKPFLFAQFFMVNTAGMVLYIGNPTNIVLSDAFNINFVKYARFMLLPSLILSAFAFFWLWVLFGRKVPPKFKEPKLEPSLALKDKNGAILDLGFLIGMILLMSLGLSAWKVALFFAILAALVDLIRKTEVLDILKKVPWKLSYFLFGFFALVRGLEITGCLSFLSALLERMAKMSYLGIVGIVLLSSLTASLINNHPMSILFAKALDACPLDAVFACIVGSNLGANLALTGALAGLLWANILATKGIEVTFSEFSRVGLLYTLPLILLAGVLLAMI